MVLYIITVKCAIKKQEDKCDKMAYSLTSLLKLNNKRYIFIYKNYHFMKLCSKSLKIVFFVLSYILNNLFPVC